MIVRSPFWPGERAMLAFFVAIAAVALTGAVLVASEEQAYAAEGVIGSATVVELGRFGGSADEQDPYVVVYEFEAVSGEHVRDRDGVRPELWHTLDAGDTLDVLYVRSRPSQSRLEPLEATAGLAVVFAAGGLLLGVVPAAVLFVRRRRSPRRELRRGG